MLAAAAVLACRALPSAQKVRALIDRHARCGGLLMASDEVALGRWSRGIPEADPPLPRWRGGRTLALCGIGPAFLLVAFQLPQDLAQAAGGALDIRRDAERMDEQLDALKEEKVMDKARADAMKAKLAQLRKDASGRDPVKTLEALDHLRDTLAKTAQQEAESAAKRMEMMAQAAALAQALEKGEGKLDDAQAAEAMAHLGGLMKKLAAEEALLQGHLDDDLREALEKGGKLSKEQLKKLAKAMDEGKGGLSKKLAKLMKAKLLDAAALQKAEKAGECDKAGLASYLKENGLDDLADKLLGEGSEGGEGGEGGTEQGEEGRTKLTFGDESSEDGARFKEQELPPSELRKIKESALEAITMGTPKKNEGGPVASRPGALSGARAGGGSATGQTVLPRHRGAVGRYFDRPGKGK